MAEDLNTDQIREWRSIVTLIVFVLTNINVLFPFYIPVYVPRQIANAFLNSLRFLRIIGPENETQEPGGPFVRLRFPMNLVTAPLIADLFLLAISAIGRSEVEGGTIGTANIHPYDIMIFFITLAYIAISIDASGLIRYLAFKVLQWGGRNGSRLFFYLYSFFFVLGSFIGNDPIILSGTAFLAYMTRVSSNIVHPRAWIYSQFAIANIASAILVSSNPTNLVLAGAFNIRFIDYTANMIVPVIITAIVLFPFLLYIVFADEDLIPTSIKMHELPEEARARKPVNPNIPNARGQPEEDEADLANNEEGKLLSLEEIMNPFLDKGGAAFGALVMGATLITVLALNAASTAIGGHKVFYITLPGAFIMFCWDLAFGWKNREETRRIAAMGREAIETTRAEREEFRRLSLAAGGVISGTPYDDISTQAHPIDTNRRHSAAGMLEKVHSTRQDHASPDNLAVSAHTSGAENGYSHESKEGTRTPHQPSTSENESAETKEHADLSSPAAAPQNNATAPLPNSLEASDRRGSKIIDRSRNAGPTTLVSIYKDVFRWAQETFPTAMAVLLHLPFALVPFAFAMFVLVQALVTKGWVPVFAYGWDHWVGKTGTVGAIGGMGFLSVVLCNFAGTNIGTTILLSRVVQSWLEIHRQNEIPISNRTFWATVYAMALGVNYGAFSTAFSASLAGLLWRDILRRKHIRVRSLDFGRVNLPIIAIAMVVGCTILIGQVYITRDKHALDLNQFGSE